MQCKKVRKPGFSSFEYMYIQKVKKSQKGFRSTHNWPLMGMHKFHYLSCHTLAYFGSHFSRASLVSSGCFVFTQPSLLVMRWTCTSTPIPSNSFHAAFITKYAIFLPTPVTSLHVSYNHKMYTMKWNVSRFIAKHFGQECVEQSHAHTHTHVY